jgi:DNA polymerase-3 subunit chi
MPDVVFHTGLPDKLGHACALLRRALRERRRVAVTADAPTLQRLDLALWAAEPQGFVPHLRLGGVAPPPARLARTPVWLVAPGVPAPACDTLLNLGAEAPPDAQAYARIVELVGTDEADRQAGRRRWAAYRAAGWSVGHHAATPAQGDRS